MQLSTSVTPSNVTGTELAFTYAALPCPTAALPDNVTCCRLAANGDPRYRAPPLSVVCAVELQQASVNDASDRGRSERNGGTATAPPTASAVLFGEHAVGKRSSGGVAKLHGASRRRGIAFEQALGHEPRRVPTLAFIGPANAVVEAGTTYVDQGATAADVVGGNLSRRWSAAAG